MTLAEAPHGAQFPAHGLGKANTNEGVRDSRHSMFCWKYLLYNDVKTFETWFDFFYLFRSKQLLRQCECIYKTREFPTLASCAAEDRCQNRKTN